MLKPRKRLVKAKLKEDKLLIYTAKVQVYYDKYQKQLYYGLAAAAAIIVLVFVVRWSFKNAEYKAAFEGMMTRDSYQRGELDDALTRANILLEDFNGTKGAAYALMVKGRVAEQRLEYAKAEDAFLKIVNDYADEEYLAFGACYALGAIHYGRGDYLEAGKWYRNAARRYPEHFQAAESLIEAGISFKRAHRYDDAKRVLRLVLSEYSKSRSVDKARSALEEIEFMD